MPKCLGRCSYSYSNLCPLLVRITLVTQQPGRTYRVPFCKQAARYDSDLPNGAFEKRALPVALEAYKLASDPRALRKKIVNA